jgi:hypothetical protein
MAEFNQLRRGVRVVAGRWGLGRVLSFNIASRCPIQVEDLFSPWR